MLDLSITISSHVAPDDRFDFLQLLEPNFDLVPDGQAVAPDWETIVAIVNSAGAAVGLVGGLASLTERVISWRRRVRQKDRMTLIRLVRRGSVLDLSTATDKEVREWISRELKPGIDDGSER